ncbi:ATP-binding protein [Alkalibacillus aidingensis]|uniref:ATP-binding protein n=1 Tax=Alkalibacillus aidingensis TaxID=2747607 RepID=UPI001660E2BC|nr:ATP-binding protein [Alkalibacillus aidingensis]
MNEPLTFSDIREIVNSIEKEDLLEPIHKWFDQHSMTVKTLYDESFNIIYTTSSVERVLGYKKQELIGTNIFDIIHPEEHDRVRGLINQMSNESKQRHEIQVRHSEGRYVDCQVHMGKIYSTDLEQLYYISETIDITEQKQAQQLLVNSEKLSTAGQLAASVAHEIRNPITSLKGFLQLLLESGTKGKEAYLRIMKRELENIESISSELLYIAKPSPEEFEEANIVTMLEEVCMLMRSQARREDKEVTLETFVDEYYLHCDRSQIKQVFINLIKNAIEAMKDSGMIEVKVKYEGSLVVEISDEGEGVPDVVKEKLGEPFITTKETGTGLGLMVTLGILKNHQADLHIEDREPKGSTFKIIFPS